MRGFSLCQRGLATREILLSEAISEIKQACSESETGSPFFIIAGAGVSAPSVPLAWEIAQECQKKAAQYGRTADPANNSSMDTYSHWLEKAYPQAIQRQRYFRKLIEGKPISHANFRLAHLLSENRLATLVVTPNFDDFLSRALTLFGQPHIVCDHPNTVERIDPESKEIQIVHVHGTYWFYDCCNLRGEIEARTEDSRERAVTMTSLLDTVLSRHSAIVIGYAGWEGDVIMNAFKRRLMSGLPNNLYWFCYQRRGLDSLRSFLKSMKSHRDVCLVLPPTLSGEPSPQIASGEKLAAIASQREPTLTAQSVLDSLVGAFTRESPALTVDPIGFFAKQLANAFPPASSEKSEEDIYDLRSVINRVELVRAHGEERPSPVEAAIERVRDANRRSEYREAIQIADSIVPQALDEEQREVLLDLVLSAALGLNDNSEDELKGYELAILVTGGHDSTSSTIPKYAARVAVALLNQGVTLGQLDRCEEAIGAYDELLRRFGDSNEFELRDKVANSFFNKGVCLGRLDRTKDEIDAYDELIRYVGDSTEFKLRNIVARSLFNKGLCLGQLNRAEEEIHAYDEILRREGDAPETDLREMVAQALVNKGIVLVEFGRNEDAIETCDEVLRRIGTASELVLRNQVAKSLFNKGCYLGRLNRVEEEIHAYDEILRRVGDAPETDLREVAAQALVNKAVRLRRVGRIEEAIEVDNEVLRRFGAASELVLRDQVAKALVNKGVALGQLTRSEEEIGAYDEILRRFGDAPELQLRVGVARALVNKGITLRQLNQNQEAIEVYDEVLRRSGDAPELILREQVASALLYRGSVLNQLKRAREARKSFQEIVTRYAASPETVLQQVVEKAKAELLDGDAGAAPTS